MRYLPAVNRIEVAQELWHAWNTGIHDGVMHHLHEDAEVRPLEVTPRTFQGHEQLDHYRTDLEAHGIQIASTPFTWEEHGNDVIVCGRSRITVKDFNDDMSLAWLFRFRGSRVALIQTFLKYDDALRYSRSASELS